MASFQERYDQSQNNNLVNKKHDMMAEGFTSGYENKYYQPADEYDPKEWEKLLNDKNQIAPGADAARAMMEDKIKRGLALDGPEAQKAFYDSMWKSQQMGAEPWAVDEANKASGMQQYGLDAYDQSRGMQNAGLNDLERYANGDLSASKAQGDSNAQRLRGDYASQAAGPRFNTASSRGATYGQAGVNQNMAGGMLDAQTQEKRAAQDAYMNALQEKRSTDAAMAQQGQGFEMGKDALRQKYLGLGLSDKEQMYKNQVDKFGIMSGQQRALSDMSAKEYANNLAGIGQMAETGGKLLGQGLSMSSTPKKEKDWEY
jgi:hypothetical protein